MSTVYRPPEGLTIPHDRRLYFLAGPIQGAPDWQQRGGEILDQLAARNPYVDPDPQIANPRREYLDGTFDYEVQVRWERANLARAARRGGIVFWFAAQDHRLPYEPGRPYAKTTTCELFRALGWLDHNPNINMAVGIDPDFHNDSLRYIRSSVAEAGLSIHTTLEATCAAVLLDQ